jgi:hypothetical protein
MAGTRPQRQSDKCKAHPAAFPQVDHKDSDHVTLKLLQETTDRQRPVCRSGQIQNPCQILRDAEVLCESLKQSVKKLRSLDFSASFEDCRHMYTCATNLPGSGDQFLKIRLENALCRGDFHHPEFNGVSSARQLQFSKTGHSDSYSEFHGSNIQGLPISHSNDGETDHCCVAFASRGVGWGRVGVGFVQTSQRVALQHSRLSPATKSIWGARAACSDVTTIKARILRPVKASSVC